MEYPGVDLHDLKASLDAHQIVGVTVDVPMTARNIHAEFAADHIVGRWDDETVIEMVKESHDNSNIRHLDEEPDLSQAEQSQQTEDQVVIYQPKAINGGETPVVTESSRLEFTKLSVARHGFQAVVSTTKLPVRADNIHCGENAGQFAGRFSNQSGLAFWKATHAATRQRRATATQAGATRNFEREINPQM